MKFHNLFDAARRESSPAVDVADSVMRTLAARRPVIYSLNRSLTWLSVASSAAAAAVVIAAFATWQQAGDSVHEILNVVAWVTQ